MTRHVEHDTARDQRRHLLSAKFGQSINRSKVAGVVAVVVHAINTQVTQAIELRADAEPAVVDVIVVGDIGIRSCRLLLAGLDDCDGKAAGRVGRC